MSKKATTIAIVNQKGGTFHSNLAHFSKQIGIISHYYYYKVVTHLLPSPFRQ